MTVFEAGKVVEDVVRAGFEALPLVADDNVTEKLPATGAVRMTLFPGEEVVMASNGLYGQPVTASLEIYRPKNKGQGQIWQDEARISALFRGKRFLPPPGGTGHLVTERLMPERRGPDSERDFYIVLVHVVFTNYSNYPEA